jgi:hypothetical protein
MKHAKDTEHTKDTTKDTKDIEHTKDTTKDTKDIEHTKDTTKDTKDTEHTKDTTKDTKDIEHTKDTTKDTEYQHTVNQTYRVTRDWEQSQQQNPSNNQQTKPKSTVGSNRGPHRPI